MAWSDDENLKLLQMQIPVELHDTIRQLTEIDRRSITQEAIFLLEQGIIRRERNLRVIDEADLTASSDDETGKRDLA
jgi:hypothetical protein